jgi:hypothetical protein
LRLTSGHGTNAVTATKQARIIMTARTSGEHTRDATALAKSAGVNDNQSCVVIGTQNGQPFTRSFANAAMMTQYLASLPAGIEITRVVGN